MCGIAGILAPGRPAGLLEPLAQTMAQAMPHRGPDGEGVWAADGLALGHRRLAILELSPLGAQPMHSATGRFTIVFNGEVFNFQELRRELTARGHAFNGGSDTEVMLAAFEEWGVAKAVPRFVGMFAFGLWDRDERRLWLCRDRLGKKPLYWTRLGGEWAGCVAFASELKALRRLPGFDAGLDRDALALFMRHNYIPAPRTVHAATCKLEPGCLASFGAGEAEPVVTRYWDLRRVWAQGSTAPFFGGPDEAAEALEVLLAGAVRLRMISDVPLGVLLSGGIDSSLIAALMCEAGQGVVRAFSVGFTDAAYDESRHARRVAKLLGCEHETLTVAPSDLLELVPSLPEMWDEPFADASQTPTHLVYRMLKGRVTVALSGDGGDECFSGYARYAWAEHFAHVERFPLFLRRMAAGLCAALPGVCLNLAGPLGRKLRWRAGLMAAADFPAFYRALVSHHHDPASLVPGSREPGTALTDPAWLLDGEDRRRQMQAWDMATYLPDDILVKADRASMGASVEARVPFLDHRVVEFAASLPGSLNAANGTGKLLLRRLLAKRLPPAAFERPKAGFTLPVEHWLAHELRDWAESLLSREALKRAGLLDPEPVRALWEAQLAGDTSRHSLLWNALMLQAWHGRWAGGTAP